MPKIAKILVPTDFSGPASQALPWAVDIAKQFGARIVLLHVIPPSAYPLHNVTQLKSFPNLRDEILKRCQEELATVAKGIQGVEVEQRVLEGGAPATIVDAASNDGADLVVMATHGHTGLKHMLLGSVAERVVRLSPCPVLTVRTGK